LPEPDLTLERSMNELRLKQQINGELFGIGKADRWDVDLDTGVIRFTTGERVASAPVQVIGTMNTDDGSWLWGWDHPSVSGSIGDAARLCRDFGGKYGLEAFTTRKIACTEDDAWQFTAVALLLSGGNGAYRGPSGSTLVFMTFGTVTLAKAN
jgi:hypothetical protein